MNDETLQFDRAELPVPATVPSTCQSCYQPLAGEYFDLNGRSICRGCSDRVEQALARRGRVSGFVRAALVGLGAAAAGSIVYYAIRELTGYEIGLISILVGWLVGRGVHWGSRGKGGWFYQGLAVFLTYLAIVSTYVPLVVKEMGEQQKASPAVAAPASSRAGSAAAPSAPSARPALSDTAKRTEGKSADEPVDLLHFLLALGAFILLLFALPFFGGFDNLLGLAIIGFGLYQAWKMNRRPAIGLSGPYPLA